MTHNINDLIHAAMIDIMYDDMTFTPPKTNMDTQNDGLEKVTPLKNGNFWYLC